LQRVRDQLLHADESTNVTAVAMRYGFSHLGRFSAYYTATFGESPSVTLRRHRLPGRSA
jgi:AraC-like DNA-binding protein